MAELVHRTSTDRQNEGQTPDHAFVSPDLPQLEYHDFSRIIGRKDRSSITACGSQALGEMSADPNALLAFKQLNLTERVRVLFVVCR